MPFSEETVKEAWKHTGGRCECTRIGHFHGSICNKTLIWEKRSALAEEGSWEAHPLMSFEDGGEDSTANCAILCVECLKKTV
jgi:hypothetical protein